MKKTEVILSKHLQWAAERRSYTIIGDVKSGEQCRKIAGIYLQQPRMTLRTDNWEQ